jgi:hypothetical protein
MNELREKAIAKWIQGVAATQYLVEEFYIRHKSPKETLEVASAHLTEAQKVELKKIAERIGKAGRISRHLVERYEINKGEQIKDKKGIYKLVLGDNLPRDAFYVLPFSICMGFWLPKEHFKDKRFNGGACRDTSRSIDSILDNVLTELEKGCERCLDIQYLSFFINYQKLQEANDSITRTMCHELKHVIDSFCGVPLEDLAIETSAHTHARNIGVVSSADESKFPKICFPEVVDLIYRACEKGISPEFLSYVVSSTPARKLSRRLKLLNEYFESRMIAAS